MDHNENLNDFPEEERHRILLDRGFLPATVVNSHNRWLERTGPVEVTGLVPTRHELATLAQFWMLEVIDYSFSVFVYGQLSGRESRRRAFGIRQLERIEQLIGKDEIAKAVDAAYKEYGERLAIPEHLRVFSEGSPVELNALKAEIDARIAALEQEQEDEL